VLEDAEGSLLPLFLGDWYYLVLPIPRDISAIDIEERDSDPEPELQVGIDCGVTTLLQANGEIGAFFGESVGFCAPSIVVGFITIVVEDGSGEVGGNSVGAITPAGTANAVAEIAEYEIYSER
jgi:hypothetical protein